MKGFIEVTELSYERSTYQDKFGLLDTKYYTTEYKQSIAVSDIKRVVPEGFRGNGKVSLILDEIYNGENVVITIKDTYEEIKQKIKEATEPRLMIDEKGNLKEI